MESSFKMKDERMLVDIPKDKIPKVNEPFIQKRKKQELSRFSSYQKRNY